MGRDRPRRRADAIENAFLRVSLSGDTWAAFPGMGFALIKFAAIAVSVLYIVAALVRGRRRAA